jgi:hypothetical protein
MPAFACGERSPGGRKMVSAFGRWPVEKWFERSKQETGFGSFEVRTYRSLMRRWLACRIAMYFLVTETRRLRGEDPQITLEQIADAANGLAWNTWNRWPHSWALLMRRCEYYQCRNQASYDSRGRTCRHNQKHLDFS